MNSYNRLKKSIPVCFLIFIALMFFGNPASASNLIEALDGTPVTDNAIIIYEGDTIISLAPRLDPSSSSDFSIDTSYIPDIEPGDEISISVTFSPTAEYDSSNPCTAIINLYQGFSVWGQIELEGITVVEEEATQKFNEIAPLLSLFHELAEDDQIKGKGHRKRAERHLAAFLKMIERAYLAVEQEKTERACNQLRVAYVQIKRTLTGDGISALTEEIKATMEELGCSERFRNKRSTWRHRVKHKFSAFKKSCRK